MSRKSPVSGVSGSVRIQRLSGVSLAAAEAHGKRLDHNGKARSVFEHAPPLTISGLDLRQLHAAHVDGAQKRKGAPEALHMVLQFPKDLVNGEDAGTMLTHANLFASSIFGAEATFADRVDRDEKGRHVVDLFLAPKYQKVTKRGSKLAVSTSKHLKELAAERGKAPTLRGQGQALQDAWFEYLRDQMGLDVKRGAKKALPGDDWQTPEELELERLREEQEAIKAENQRLKTIVQEQEAFIADAERIADTHWDRASAAMDAVSAAEAQRAAIEGDITQIHEKALHEAQEAADGLLAQAQDRGVKEALRVTDEVSKRLEQQLLTEGQKALRNVERERDQWRTAFELLRDAVKSLVPADLYQTVKDQFMGKWSRHPDNPDRKPEPPPSYSSGPSGP